MSTDDNTLVKNKAGAVCCRPPIEHADHVLDKIKAPFKAVPRLSHLLLSDDNMKECNASSCDESDDDNMAEQSPHTNRPCDHTMGSVECL